ncbi:MULTISPECIES: hypothetical protein [Halomonadaceae]|uniref:Uncharacterized protein n=1 Tax=Modicisalibacter zincidurans TaxID=1178777 RepID=A0ABP9RB00_9GAMM|nr:MULTISPECIES: hypothetical protein [Halomonas]MCD6008139.1 hypothetical protein [Halomonas sp. IOP_31]MEA3250239.1 hypothetical protein [Pseudomonadota bacterium]
MERKFKEGPYRLIVWLTALSILALALVWRGESAAPVLVVGALLLVIVTHARPGGIHLANAWLPALLALVLTLVLALDPQYFLLWLWAWVAVLALPQPPWLLALNAALATLSYFDSRTAFPIEQGVLAGLLLATLGLLAIARSLSLQASWRTQHRYAERIPDAMFWSRHQLEQDLPEETARCQREKTHGMLVLVRQKSRTSTLARLLVDHTRSYESGYQLDRHVLAALLISRDATEGGQRRDALKAALPGISQARFVTLAPGLELAGQLRALAHQSRPLIVLEESA